MDKPELKKIPARCGCQGCYFDIHSGCEVDKYVDEHGLPLPPRESWPCNNEDMSYIFVPIEEAE